MADQNNFINPEKEIENINENKNLIESDNEKSENFAIEKTNEESGGKNENIKTKETKEFSEFTNPEKEEKPENLDNKIEALVNKLKKQKQKNTNIPLVKDELNIRIEKIMEEGLEEAFKELSPIEQQEFKIKGEETAWKIRQALKKTHVKIKEIFKLLFSWLKLLPGINKFFLEQEAKIKADKIFSLRKFK